MTDFSTWADENWPGLYDWLRDCERGVSSETLVYWATGLPCRSKSPPMDAGDLKRCVDLCRAVPKIAGTLDRLVEWDRPWAPWVAKIKAALNAYNQQEQETPK